MKLTPIWINPVGWSQHAAKTKRRVFAFVLIHLCFVLFGLGVIYWAVDAFREIPQGRLLAIGLGASPILFVAVGYPALYLYAMHRLLLMLKTNGTLPAS